MKRIAALLFSILFILLAACGADLSNSQMDSAVQTLTATVRPPTPTPTPDPDENAIVLLLNHGIEQTADALSETIDAHYQVIDVSFPSGLNAQASTFLIQVRCECVGTSCCTPQRTFVVLMNAMKPVAEKIARQVPLTVTDVQVTCLDHSTSLGMVMAAWRDIADYFSGQINGFQLGGRVITLGP
jgi:hypothetical protein